MEEIKHEHEVYGRKVIKISKKRIWHIVIFLIVVFLGLRYLVLPFLSNTTGIGPGSGAMRMGSSQSADSAGGSFMPRFPDIYPGNQTSSYKDTREFLKTNYSAQIRTRDVSDIMKDVKNSVKGADGRIDSINVSDKYGYVNFVVPKSNFDTFKDEIESLVHEKLITISESSTNLLSQKQQIETDATNIQNNLTSLEKAKADLTTKHNQKIASLNNQIAALQAQVNAKQAEIDAATTAPQKATLQNEQQNYNSQRQVLEQQKASENSSYTIQNKNYDSQITATKNNQTNNVKQDGQFTDNIETVNGSINVTWINIWNIVKIFSPVHPTLIVIILALALIFYLNRRGYVPKIMFV